MVVPYCDVWQTLQITKSGKYIQKSIISIHHSTDNILVYL